MNDKLLVTVCMDTKSGDVIEQLLRCHDVIDQPCPVEEVADIVTVSEQEHKSVRVGGLYRLAHVNEVDVSFVPQHVVLTQISMY